MANTIASGLYADHVKQGALQGFVDALLSIVSFSTDISADPGIKNKSVTVPLISTTAAGDFAGDYTANPDSTVGEVQVVLNVHKFKTVHLTDVQASQTPVKLEELGYQAGQAVGLGVLENILSIITAENFGAPVFTGGASAFDSDDVVDIKTGCDNAKIPVGGRNMVLASEYTGSLLKDDSIKTVANLGNDEAVRNGMFTKLSGFRMFESNIVPDNAEHLVGFAGVPSGIAIAMRYLEPQSGHKYSVAEALVDDQTGLVLGVREFYDEKAGIKYLTFECLAGKSVGIAAGLKRIVSE